MRRQQAACAGDIAGAQRRCTPACNLGARRACDDHASECIDRQMIGMHAHASPTNSGSRLTTSAKTNRYSWSD
ncbi:hypothetical protein DEG02_016760 [Xanthomonas vasicola]|nr:hypothetical protein KWO_008555 [Xanthomonas vasicola pv. musacearum NCPPB 4379]AZR35382.1 hypothetical protein NX08_013815 [Xanthomonas vasicola]RRJ37176.1 hypothetical protein EIM46_18070 [Xanthomonas vasicola pv. musacearum]RJL82395.1 hypothetical protein DEG03_014050 [Xanthomonas vasicola]RJL84732.1 hypothetical protein DEF98_014165 [Xanthomonas vasicola]